MSSSNRHWPSMFKSKPCNNPHNNQWQHDINNSSLVSTGYQKNPYAASGGEEKTPEPKPRWNPKPDQIRILEAIFNSGMVNPPRDEIRKIRLQLQEYGQVGDANVFYWFQNRKSRSKHKLRHLQNSKNYHQNAEAQQEKVDAASLSQITPPSSSSSSSEKSSSKEVVYPNSGSFSFGFSNVNDNAAVPNSPTASVNQTYFQPNDTNLLPPPPTEPFSFTMHNNGQSGVANNTIANGFSMPQFSDYMMQQSQLQCQQNVGPCTSLLLNEIMDHGTLSKKYHPQLGFSLTSAPTTTYAPPISTLPCPITHLQDRAKCTVFINNVAFEVVMGPFNVRQAFGDEAMLIHSSGDPVPTDEWGISIHSLQHGAYYYLI